MPSPIVHSAVGVSFILAARRSFSLRLFVLSIAVAIVPDLDLLPGLIAGDPNRYHHLHTHSAPFALFMALFFAAPAWMPESVSYSARFKYFLPLSATHFMLDLFNDARHEIAMGLYVPGIAVGWPFSSRQWDVLYPLFPTATMLADWRTWFSPENIKVFAIEGTVATLILGVGLIARGVRSAAPVGSLQTGAER